MSAPEFIQYACAKPECPGILIFIMGIKANPVCMKCGAECPRLADARLFDVTADPPRLIVGSERAELEGGLR